jgi:hypothetical protein
MKVYRLFVLALALTGSMACSRSNTSEGRLLKTSAVFVVSATAPISTDIYTVSLSVTGLQLHRATNAESGFTPLSISGPNNIISVKVDPFNAGAIFVSGVNKSEDFAFRSDDKGESFQRLSNGLPAAANGSRQIAFVTPDANIKDRVWLGFVQNAGSAIVPVYRSDNRGQDWAPAATAFPKVSATKIAFDSTNSSLIVISTEAGLARSSDAGVSWQTDNLGLPADSLISDIVADPSTPGRFYTVANFRLFRRESGIDWVEIAAADNLGAQFTPSSRPIKVLPTSVKIDPGKPLKIVLGVRFFGVFISDDGGSSFTRRSTGLRSTADYAVNTQEILIDSSNSEVIYLATEAGPYMSSDGGMSWTVLNESGLPIFTKRVP